MLIKAYASGGAGGSRGGRTPIGVQYMSARNRGLTERRAINQISRTTGRSTASVRQALNRMTFTQGR